MVKAANKKAPTKAALAKAAKAAKTKNVVVPEVVVEQPIVQEPAAEDGGAQLTIADLQAIAQVIDMAVRRGAFGASEVSEVGAIYGKLSNFLQIIAAQTKEAEGGK